MTDLPSALQLAASSDKNISPSSYSSLGSLIDLLFLMTLNIDLSKITPVINSLETETVVKLKQKCSSSVFERGVIVPKGTSGEHLRKI